MEQLTACLALDTSDTMWLLVLHLALFLWETGVALRIQSRVIGGQECVPHSQPWQVALHRYSRYTCGGVLVDPSWVLTAAHCVEDNYQVWLGRHDLYENEKTFQHILVTKAFPHPEFNMSLLKQHPSHPDDDYSHDLMLLHLKNPAKITDAVQVVKLPTEPAVQGTSCVASGWGSTDANRPVYTEQLHCVDLEILPQKDCEASHIEKVTEYMLCAGHLQGGKDTCLGDSGGPLVCDGVLQGITSWGDMPCALPNSPAIYSNVEKHLEWIKNTIAENP